MAWNRLSRPSLAEPPAESPSTIYSSVRMLSRSEQSANFPGREALSRADFLRVSSLAFRAASLARLAVMDLSMMVRATLGFSSKKVLSFSVTIPATRERISLLFSFALVWLSNWASVSLTLMTAVRPSRTSSPESFSPSLRILRRRP